MLQWGERVAASTRLINEVKEEKLMSSLNQVEFKREVFIALLTEFLYLKI